MTQQKIQEFNQMLVNEKIDITIVDYVKQINELVFQIDISFIDDFIDLVDNDDFKISHYLLNKYEVLKIRDTFDIKRILDQYEFEEGKDYIVESRKSAGGLEYILKPEIFKMLLMRSRNTRKYAEYFILLEKCIKHYNDFQILKQQQQIDKLEQTLKNRVILPGCKSKHENLAVVYLEDEPEYQYYVIRGQKQHIRKQLKRLNKTEEDIIASIDLTTIHLTQLIYGSTLKINWKNI